MDRVVGPKLGAKLVQDWDKGVDQVLHKELVEFLLEESPREVIHIGLEE
jgi:hypothetical protein